MPLVWRQESRENGRRLLPVSRLALELPSSCAREVVVLGLAIVVRDAPFGRDVSLLLKFQKRWIQRAVIHRQQIAARLLDAACNPISMQRTDRFEGLQNH